MCLRGLHSGGTAQAISYTISLGAKKRHGFDSPITEGAVAAPTIGQRLFYVHVLRMASTAIYFGRPCWGIRKSAPVPSAGLSTRHGLPPTFDSVEAGFKPVPKEPFMANPTRKGPHCCAHTTARSNSSIVSDVLSATRQRNTNCTKPQLHLANKIPKNTACLKKSASDFAKKF